MQPPGAPPLPPPLPSLPLLSLPSQPGGGGGGSVTGTKNCGAVAAWLKGLTGSPHQAVVEERLRGIRAALGDAGVVEARKQWGHWLAAPFLCVQEAVRMHSERTQGALREHEERVLFHELASIDVATDVCTKV